jgi:hypothetical protein
VKNISWLISTVALALLVFSAACGKKQAFQQPQTVEEGVTQLRAALVNANANIQSNLYGGVDYGVRYGNYVNAMAALDRIAADASLTEQQKKLVNDVMNLLKQKAQGQPAPAAR